MIYVEYYPDEDSVYITKKFYLRMSTKNNVFSRRIDADISLDKPDIQVYTVNINILFMKKQLTMYICPFNHNNNQDSIYDIMWK